MTKFRTRILPQLLAGQKASGALPARLTFALAALIAFYRGERDSVTYPLQDDAHWLERYSQWWSAVNANTMTIRELVTKVLGDSEHWGQDLNQVAGLTDKVAADLEQIVTVGMRAAVNPLC